MDKPKLGISNIKTLVLISVELANVIDGVANADGFAAKGQEVFRLADELMLIPNLDVKAAIEEAKDLDSAEKAELHEAVKAKFDIKDDKLEAVIEGGLGLALKLEELVKEGIALAKSLKKEEPAQA